MPKTGMNQKRVIVVTSDVPFVRGGHRIIAENTVEALSSAGYNGEVHYTPQNRFGRQLSAYFVNRFTDLNYTDDNRGIDRIICMRFPSYVVPHPNKVVWLVHRLREYYDLWHEYKNQLSWKAKVKESFRRFVIHRLDEHYLTKGIKRIFTISGQVKKRLEAWGGINAEVLYPPVSKSNWHCTDYGDYFLYVSRLMKHKRVDLFIRAASMVKDKKIKFIIAGGGPEERNLKKLVSNLKLTRRVELTGPVDQDELVSLYASARGLVFTPLREEYGFVTVEAFRSDKPVITTTDSGGPTELVINSENGFITEPNPKTIAEKMDLLASDTDLARQMGQSGNQSTAYINWDNTVKMLMEP